MNHPDRHTDALQAWAVPKLKKLPGLQLDAPSLREFVLSTTALDDAEAARHMESFLGDSPKALAFIGAFLARRGKFLSGSSAQGAASTPPSNPPGTAHDSTQSESNQKAAARQDSQDTKAQDAPPPPYGALSGPPAAGPAAPSPAPARSYRVHTNAVIQAGELRSRDEQSMQQQLLNVQFEHRIYNAEIEPEHDTDFPCGCSIHAYQRRKWARVGIQETWCRAVMYPGEKFYTDVPYATFSVNPYTFRVMFGPYGYPGMQKSNYLMQMPRPVASYHRQWITQVIRVNNQLNQEAQAKVDAQEPRQSIWAVAEEEEEDGKDVSKVMGKLALGEKTSAAGSGEKDAANGADGSSAATTARKRQSLLHFGHSSPHSDAPTEKDKEKSTSKLTTLRKTLGLKSADEKASDRAAKLRTDILWEEQGRWPDASWRALVATYQAKTGMTAKIAHLRAHCPLQYLHLLRAGYFEPIPVAWAAQASNPLKFVVEAQAGWRGVTPAWRGYEDLAEERLYWVLNHREGTPTDRRLKPDFISAMDMARARMARAIEPPPLYFSESDTCHVQHTTSAAGYSKQVPLAPFRPHDRPESPADDTMILLDVSGSMGFTPVRPIYDEYLVTGYAPSAQPKNQDVARAIVRRFTDAMANRDRRTDGYDMVTFADSARYIGRVHHRNLDAVWRDKVRVGGGTRVMTGWQMVKELHFRQHAESASKHPVFGWQAGPSTPMLRLLLLLDGEATDMDEFELDLLGLSWAHVTIFLIGVDGCPHHHRHANELQRISEVNPHVSFVDAQGNCPERFVTHELLKRHLGVDLSVQEFEGLEELPAYTAVA